MPRVSHWTDLLGEAFLAQVDALCEELKTQLGWPPLGQKELSPSGARARERADVAILADLLSRMGPEGAVGLLRTGGIELLDRFGERVVSEAMVRAERAFLTEAGRDGTEVYLEAQP